MAATLGHQQRQHLRCNVEQAQHIGLQHLPPGGQLVSCGLGDLVGATGQPCVVDQDIQTAKLLHRRLDELAHRSVVGHV